MPSINSPTPDATTTSKGKIQLAGDLAGNAALPRLSTSAILLGYAQITTTFTSASTSYTQVTGLSTTITIPAGGRTIKITSYVSAMSTTAATAGLFMSIWDGAVGTGTQLSQLEVDQFNATFQGGGPCIAVVTPAAGSKTYNIGFRTTAGTGSFTAGTTAPGFILVELI